MAKAHWIMAADRVPRVTENVVVTIVDNKGRRSISMAYYDSQAGCWRSVYNSRKVNVIAWMGIKPWEG